MKIAEEKGMGGRINVIMQTAFFKISGVLPEQQAIDLIKKYIEKAYGKKGRDIVEANISTIDAALAGVHEVKYPKQVRSKTRMLAPVPETAPQFVKEVIGILPGCPRNRSGSDEQVLQTHGQVLQAVRLCGRSRC